METSQHIPTLGELGYLDPAQLAAFLNVKTTTLSNWRSKEFGPPATKIHGTKIVYSLDGVKRWLADRTSSPAKPGTLITGKATATRTPITPRVSALGRTGGNAGGLAKARKSQRKGAAPVADSAP